MTVILAERTDSARASRSPRLRADSTRSNCSAASVRARMAPRPRLAPVMRAIRFMRLPPDRRRPATTITLSVVREGCEPPRANGQSGPVRTDRCGSVDGEKASTAGTRHGLRTVVGAQFVEDGGHVKLHRAFGDPERRRNLVVGLAGGNQTQNRKFARG